MSKYGAIAILSLFLTTAQAQQKKRPFEITDNSFFIEEAFNQEPGIIQNIFTWHWVRDLKGTDQDSVSFSFTQEWPIASQKHQFSFVIPAEYLSASSFAGLSRSERGVGDMLVNYRYQALTEEDDGAAFAPRLSLVLPTGDQDIGFGNGTLGYQFNLPVSRQFGDFYVHFNAGMTFFPHAESGAAQARVRDDLWGYRVGGSLIWRATESVNVLVEVLADVMDEFEEEGKRKIPVGLFSPGLRWGKWLGKTQLVAGAGLPIGISGEADDVGFFFYLSLEFPFK